MNNELKSSKKNKKSPQKPFALFIIVQLFIIFGFFVFVLFTFFSVYKMAKDDAVAIGQKSVREVSEKLNNFLTKSESVLEVTAETIDYMMQHGNTAFEIDSYLKYETAKYSKTVDQNFTGIYGILGDVYIDGVDWLPDSEYVPQDRDWYKFALEGNGTPVIIPPYVDAQTGDVIISISKMLSDGKSVFALDVKLNALQEFAKEVSFNGDGCGFIISDESFIIAHSWSEEIGKNYLHDEEIPYVWKHEVAELVQKNSKLNCEVSLDFGKSFIFSEKLPCEWSVVMLVPLDELFQRAQRNIIINVVIAILVLIFVIYFCTLNYFNRIKTAELAEKLQKFHIILKQKLKIQSNQLKSQTKKLLIMQETVIEGMASLIEYRDVNTGKHVKHTKRYVLMIAKYLYKNQLHSDEVDRKFVWMIGNAAALHDVGKIAITDEILNKPGKLSEYEYEVMKTHTMIGGAIVRNIFAHGIDKTMLTMCSEVAQYHHERWDGKGYPLGLSGNDIPLAARIMAIADVFDALVSKRVYKDPVPVENVFNKIKVEAGAQFDPELTEIFLSLKDEILKFLEKEEAKEEK